MQPEQLADAAQQMGAIDAARHAHLPTPHVDESSVADTLLSCLKSMSTEGAPRPSAPAPPPPAANGQTQVPACTPKRASVSRLRATPPATQLRTPAPAPATPAPPASHIDVGSPHAGRSPRSAFQRPHGHSRRSAQPSVGAASAWIHSLPSPWARPRYAMGRRKWLLRADRHTKPSRVPFRDCHAAQPSASTSAQARVTRGTLFSPTPYSVAGGIMPNSCRWRLTAMGAIAGRPAPPQVRARWGLRVPSLVWCLGRLALAFLCR